MGDQPSTVSPVPELYPGHAAEAARQARRLAAIKESNGEPLPGPLMDAFAHVPECIAGLTVRPLVHYDFVILRKLESPLLEQLKKKPTDQPTPYTDDQAYEILFQLTRPVQEVKAALNKGRQSYQLLAQEEIGMKLGPIEVGLLVQAVEREFLRYFSTAVKYGAKPTEGGTTQVFTPPPAAPTTASAGGSTTSHA